MPKNDITRSRGGYPGEAGADWESGATAKPEADEHHGRKRDGGLAGHDKQQGDLQDRGTYRQPNLPEGLTRERKGPLDNHVGRGEAAPQVPKNSHPKEGE